MRVVVLRPVGQQLRDVVGRVKGFEIGSQLRESLDDLCLRQQIETVRGFAEEDYTADGEQIKGTFKVRLEPPPSLRQHAHSAEFPRPERGDAAGLAPVGRAQYQGLGFLGGHGPYSSGAISGSPSSRR